MTPNENEILVAGDKSVQKAGYYSTQIAGYESTQTAGHISIQKAGDDSTQIIGDRSTQTAGDTFKKSLYDLRANVFPNKLFDQKNDNKRKIFTWIRMIIAFNMYAEIRNHFRLHPYNRIDFIGSIKDTVRFDVHIYYAYWKRYFIGRRVMFIEDKILLKMINFVKNGDTDLFWDKIFSMYNNCIANDKY